MLATHVAGDALMMQPGAVDAATVLATYVAGDADDAVCTSHEMRSVCKQMNASGAG